MKSIIAFGCCALLSITVAAQQHKEMLREKVSFEKQLTGATTLIVSNVSGSITIVGYEGKEVLVEAEKIINAKTEERLQKGIAEVRLGIVNDVDTVVIYAQDGCNRLVRSRDRGYKNWNQYGWAYHSEQDDNQDCNTLYDHRMNFIIKVPKNLNVIASTINNGDVQVSQVNGAVKVHNINGSIKLRDLESQSVATSINGDVDIEYVRHPPGDCRFYSLNGDINANFPEGLAAELTFESFNGDFYTNIEAIESMPLKVVKNNTGNGVRYKINGNRYQVRKGGPYLDFETFNGNVYLKEK